MNTPFPATSSSSGTSSPATDTHADSIGHSPKYVIAIGASAGGLDALEKFFIHFPSDSGAAFVVIQHLSPDHKSIMDSLLSRHTSMPVKTVTHNMEIEANSVFLIPSGSMMHLEGQRFFLTPKSPRTLSLPIDVFFQSLASNFKEKSVGVILSGTGSDGTRGAGAINEAGGLLVAQDPESAKFDGMPRSVISTGLVDAILPVEAMGERISIHVLGHRSLSHATSHRPDDDLNDTSDSAYNRIIELLRQQGGINFADYKPGTVTRRIERRVAVCQLGSMDEYVSLLHEDPQELLTLRRELLIPVTSFFRDSEAFETLRRQVVDTLLSSKNIDLGIRVWCAGVSTGEEAYSIAMMFLEAFESIKRWPALKIFATDIEQQNIDTASAGIYPESIIAEVSSEQLERFFTKRGNQFVVKNELRQRIVFAKHNLLSDPPFTKMDLVVCRNVLIYFNAEAQLRVLRRLQYALKPHSFLFLGSSESLATLQPDFLAVSSRYKIWKVIKPTPMPLEMDGRAYGNIGLANSNYRKANVTAKWESRSHSQSVAQLGYEKLLQSFAPPAAILIGSNHELLHSYGNAGRYLQIRAGSATFDVAKILPDALVPVATALIFKSMRESSSTISDIVRVKLNDASDTSALAIRLSAWPITEPDKEGQQQPLTLLVFEELTEQLKESRAVAVDIELETSERIEVLQNELAATRESLQATIEELETSNEELQATNEEMMASNEELQSSNEELQSVNEELNTVNSEYQEKIEILNRVNADLDNLAKVVASGTIFVDMKLNITRFSPDALKIFKLRDSDIGRPLSDISHILFYPQMGKDLHHCISTGEMLEKYIDSSTGLNYLVKMLPYRIPSSAENGLIITFVDITTIKKASKLQEILDASFESLAVIDYSGKLIISNQSWLNGNNFSDSYKITSIPIGENYIDYCKNNIDKFSWASTLHENISRIIFNHQKEFMLSFENNRILVLGKSMANDHRSILLQVINKDNFSI